MNPRFLPLVFGLALGYLLGARAGREKYDSMKEKAKALWEDPRLAKARKDVEDYARQQAPIIRERAEAAAKAAPTVAKDVADRVSTTAKDVAGRVSGTAKDVADRVTTTAKDITGRVTEATGITRDNAPDVVEDEGDRKD